MAQLHYVTVRLHHFVGVARPEQTSPGMARNEASCSTGWWVGPSSPSPMASCVKMKMRREFHHGGESDGPARVITEDKEGPPKGANFESDIPFTTPPWRARGYRSACSCRPESRAEIARASEGERVLFEGPRSPEPPRNQGMFCASTFSTLPEASRPAIPLGSAGKTGRLWSQPSGVRGAASDRSQSRGRHTALCIRGEFVPFLVGLGATRADAFREMFVDAVRHQELRVFGPSISALGQADFFLAQRLAMRG